MNINPNRSLPELATRRSFLNATGALSPLVVPAYVIR